MPQDWPTSLLSCGPTVYKADSFEIVSDPLCGGLDNNCTFDSPFGGATLCNFYLENEPYNKPYTGPGLQTNSSTCSIPSFKGDDVLMGDDRFSVSPPNSNSDKSRRSLPDSEIGSDIFKSDHSVLRPGNVYDVDVNHSILLSPIRSKVRNDISHDEPMHDFVRAWEDKQGAE